MGYNPEGTWNWNKFWKSLTKPAVVVAVVAVVVVATVVTGGVGTALIYGAAAVAGAVAGAAIVAEFQDPHYDRLNITGDDLPDRIPAGIEAYEQYKEENKYNYNFDVKANCHQFTATPGHPNIKIVSLDGKYEAIYNGKTGEPVTDPRDIGTYNYYDPDTNPIKHGIVDVLPWILWGNSEDDTTTVFDRIWYSINGPNWFK